MISYDQLAIAEKAEYALEQLTSVVNYFQCDDRFSEFEFALNSVDSNDISIIRIAIDPNEPQPSWWCVNTVETTASVLMGIVANIRAGAVKVSATRLIGKLEQKAINCCYAGGLWSACIQPLADKLQQWLQKWKVFGIPPDSSWDSDL